VEETGRREEPDACHKPTPVPSIVGFMHVLPLSLEQGILDISEIIMLMTARLCDRPYAAAFLDIVYPIT